MLRKRILTELLLQFMIGLYITVLKDIHLKNIIFYTDMRLRLLLKGILQPTSYLKRKFMKAPS